MFNEREASSVCRVATVRLDWLFCDGAASAGQPRLCYVAVGPQEHSAHATGVRLQLTRGALLSEMVL